MWYPSMADYITSIIQLCSCPQSSTPAHHPKVAIRPPSVDPMNRIIIDILHFESNNFLHSVDEATAWSEAGRITNKIITHKLAVIERIHSWRHGTPRYIRCDNEFNDDEFVIYYLYHGIKLLPVAANDHEANGLI